MKLVCNFAMVVALVVMLSAVPSTDAAAKCEAGDTGPKCASCARKGTCAGVAVGDDVAPLEACPIDKACTIVSGLAVCRPVAETECDCGGAGAVRGCDAYNPQRINICLPNRRPILDGTCDNTQLCSSGVCAGPAVTSCLGTTDLTFKLTPPDCSVGALCYSNRVAAVTWCEAGKYFDVVSGQCETYSDNPCESCSQSMCPILSDCTSYAACAGGEVVSIETCATSGTYFDVTAQKCTASPSEPCSLYTSCDFGLIRRR